MTEGVLSSTAISYAPPRAAEAVGPQSGPVQPRERIQLLDVLRGFALFGILQVNWPDWRGTLGNILTFLVDDKMRTIYSFLFGLGFAIQLIRAQERGRPFALRYAWRSLLLLAIGCLHFAFIWQGDIVREYAVMSLTLLIVARWRPGFVFGFAVLALLLGVTPRAKLPGLDPANGSLTMRADPERAGADPLQQREDRERHWVAPGAEATHGATLRTYPLAFRGGAASLLQELRSLTIYRFISGQLLALFLLGFWVGRKRILHEPERHVRLLTWVVAIGLPLGLFSNLFNTFGDWFAKHKVPVLGSIPVEGTMGSVFYEVGNLLLALAYIAGISLIVVRAGRLRSWLAWALAPVGRMGITNYLMQSVILTVMLYGPGLYLSAELGGWWRQAVLQLVFVIQIVYSRWWFARFQYGPVEWAWRSLTWFKLQPMRAKAAHAAA
jgi:uncharacterized protein